MWAALKAPTQSDDASSSSDLRQLEARMTQRFDKLEKGMEQVLRLLQSTDGAGRIVVGDGGAAGELAEEEIVDDEPWSTVLQGDPQVRGMMKDLRTAGRANANAGMRAKTGAKTGVRGRASALVQDERSAPGGGSSLPLWQQQLLNVPVLHPEGKVRSGWNALMGLLICWCAVVVPLEIGYDSALRVALGDGFGAWEAINYTFDFIFLFDIALNFRTGFLVDGQFVTSTRQIALHYLRGAFFVDLIGSFPINLIIDLAVDDDGGTDSSAGRLNRPLRMLRIVKLNRLLRLSKLSKYLKYLEVILEFNPSFLRVLKLMILMIMCCHWMGCGWWLVTELELSGIANALTGVENSTIAPLDARRVNQNVWQPSQELLDADLSQQFASGFFWGASFITAMVPYDIMPATAVEYYVTASCMFVGLLLNAFVIGSMASALSSLDSKKQICRGKLETIGLYLLVNNVSADLRGRILEYYEYLYTSTQSMQDLRIYQDLPPSLATRLAITVHRRIVSRTPLFNALSDAALLALLARLRPLIYVPGQVLLMEGQLLKEISFLKKGSVHLLQHVGTESEAIIGVRGANDHVGLTERMTRDISRQMAAPPPEGGGGGAPGSSSALLLRRGSRASGGLNAEGEGWFRHYLTTQHVDDSARAATYCDVVSLSVEALAELLVQDYKARVERERRMTRRSRAAKQTGSTVGGMGMRIKFMQRFMGLRNSASNSSGRLNAAPAGAPGASKAGGGKAAGQLAPVDEGGNAEAKGGDDAEDVAGESSKGGGPFLEGVKKAATSSPTNGGGGGAPPGPSSGAAVAEDAGAAAAAAPAEADVGASAGGGAPPSAVEDRMTRSSLLYA